MLPKETREWLAAIGRRGGSTKSKAKARAARENGKKGGRPRSDREKDWMRLVLTWPRSPAELLAAHGVKARPGPKTRKVVWSRDASGKMRKKVLSDASWLNSGIGSSDDGFLTFKTPEFHSRATRSSLSDMLETGDVPERFSLSAKACAGILHRAERRGKKLPENLERALKERVARGD